MRNKEVNYGICLLRLLMCFEVIITHFYTAVDRNICGIILSRMTRLAVPTFFIISFYYLCRLDVNDGKAVKKDLIEF